MALAQTQALLARLFTDDDLRREFFEAPIAVAMRFGLSMHDTQRLAGIDRRETEAFAQSLIGKRALYARKALPLTARALGDRFDALFRAGDPRRCARCDKSLGRCGAHCIS